MDIFDLVDPKDLLSFSQAFSVTRNYLGDRIFPDIKTQNLKAEFFRLSDPMMLPTMALVHAFDTEAAIGARPTFEKVKLEKMLIKEKINQTERIQYLIDNGADADSLVKYVFDDVARLSESVKTRTEVMKCELLETGKVSVDENKLKFSIDYGVPSSNKIAWDWSAASADILGMFQALVDLAKSNGQTIRKVVTSNSILNKIRQNTGIQTAILGTLGQGTFVSLDKLTSFIETEYHFTIETYDERYRFKKKDGSYMTKRYIGENKFIAMSTMTSSAMGTGLWGVTPEERAIGPWTSKSAKQYITSVMWKTPDPVATWTKSSGLFVPVLPNPNGLFIATVTLS